MPRAIRHFLPRNVWYLTHRCHERDLFLLAAFGSEAEDGVDGNELLRSQL